MHRVKHQDRVLYSQIGPAGTHARTFMAGTPSRAQKTMVTGGRGAMGTCISGHCGAAGASK